jgi:putative zinc finger protein
MRFKCDDLKERWPEYIYRELPEHEQSLFVHHLEECEDCRAEERQWRSMLSEFDSIVLFDDSMEAPTELLYRVKRQVRFYEEWSAKNKQSMRKWGIGAAAACALIICGLWGAYHDRLDTKISAKENSTLQPIQASILDSIYDPDIVIQYHEHGVLNKPVKINSSVDDKDKEQSKNKSEDDK